MDKNYRGLIILCFVCICLFDYYFWHASTNKSSNSFASDISRYAIGISVLAFITTSFSFVGDATEKQLSKVINSLEKFYKPLQKILTDTYDLNFNLNHMVVNLRELKQYDHLARPEIRKLFRECTVIKNVDEKVLKEKIIELREKVNSIIEKNERRLDKDD